MACVRTGFYLALVVIGVVALCVLVAPLGNLQVPDMIAATVATTSIDASSPPLTQMPDMTSAKAATTYFGAPGSRLPQQAKLQSSGPRQDYRALSHRAFPTLSFDDVHAETSKLSTSCAADLQTDDERQRSTVNEICGEAGDYSFTERTDKLTYLTSVYGESIFDSLGFCSLCVALASLFCTKPQFPVIVMHTEEVPLSQLVLLETLFKVQLLKVSHIPPSEDCLKKIHPSQARLSSVLMKLNYWNLTQYDRIVVFDSDVLFLHNLDTLLLEKFTTPTAAAARGKQAEKIRGRKAIRKHFNFNGGLIVAKPSQRIFGKLIAAIPKLKDARSLTVE